MGEEGKQRVGCFEIGEEVERVGRMAQIYDIPSGRPAPNSH